MQGDGHGRRHDYTKGRRQVGRTGGMLGPGRGGGLFDADCGARPAQWLCPSVSTSPSWYQLGEDNRSSFLCLRVGGEFNLPG